MACRARLLRQHTRIAQVLDAKPHCHWLLVYAVLCVYFSVFRCLALSSALQAFASAAQHTAGIKAAILIFGLVEDALLVTLLLVALAAVDYVVGPRRTPASIVKVDKPTATSDAVAPDQQSPVSQSTPVQPTADGDEADEPVIPPEFKRAVLLYGRRLLRFASFTVLIVLSMAPFAVDNVLLRARGLRFTYGFVRLYAREFEYAAGVHVSADEVRMSTEITVATALVATLVLTVAMLWLDFSQWHLLRLVPLSANFRKPSTRHPRPTCVGSAIELIDMSKHSDAAVADIDYYRSLEDGGEANVEASGHRSVSHGDYVAETDAASPSSKRTIDRAWWMHRFVAIGVHILLITVATAVVYGVAHAIPAVVSAAALNGSLNELCRGVFGFQLVHSLGDGTLESASVYLSPETEQFQLFQNDVLFRNTTGFQGDVAFDVRVDHTTTDLPNVLVLVVESFRAQDSAYLSGNWSANVSLTPQFDRWAKRGVAFSNMWSSWQTSRSIESILFGQVPFDDITATGTTNGRKNVQLQGMPQFFHAKGYETTFSSGVRLKFDQWDAFLPAHGFDYVLGSTVMKAYAETDLGINGSEWDEGRSGFWGVHDDVTFEVLGNLMVNKTAAQAARVQSNLPKEPFFINHYTVSSHAPFTDSPSGFNGVSGVPDLSPLTKGADPEHAALIERYARLRFFQDLELGKFLDRMQQAGVLNDTIVVIVGDQGQSPENGVVRPDVDEVATTRVAAALVAEGRLGQYAGLNIDDATHQYDLLNTLMDIVGVPEGGFLQTSVGRSLKRSVPFGQWPVWTNNPMRRFGAVQGHRRLSYDRVFSMLGLFDVDDDPHEVRDLWTSVDDDERRQWEVLRERGRRLSRYFKVRWDNNCLTQAEC